MTEDDARDWLAGQFPAASLDKLAHFVALLEAEAEQQSLIARSTFESIWSRHIVDSAQLLLLAPRDGRWLDIGSGGGLPGIVIAVLRDAPVMMSEPRRRRAEFLNDAVAALGLPNATVSGLKAQDIIDPADVVSARAVAPISEIFSWTEHNVSRETRFVLPRGRSWALELEIARHAWHGSFHVEQSITNPESGIVVAAAITQR